MSEAEIEQVLQTGNVSNEVLTRLSEKDRRLLGFRLRDKQNEIKRLENVAKEKENELEKTRLALKYMEQTIEENKQSMQQMSQRIVVQQSSLTDHEKIVSQLLAQKNEEEKKTQSLRDQMKQFQNEVLENTKKTQEMIEKSNRIRKSCETKEKLPEKLTNSTTEAPKPIVSSEGSNAKPQERQTEPEIVPKKQEVQQPFSFAAALN